MQNTNSLTQSAILRRYLLIPTIAFAAAFLALTYSGLDHAIAGAIFDALGGSWRLRDNALLEVGFHQFGKYVSILAWFACISVFIRHRKDGLVSPRQKALLLLIIAVIATTTIASTLKGVTHMDCPWDLTIFGGHKVYVPLLERDFLNAEPGRCFPAGQASAGYAWIALYFAALLYKPEWRCKGLAVGLSFGLLLGIAQQIRGAHFLSHDLTTAWIAWVIGAIAYAAFNNLGKYNYRNEKPIAVHP